MTLINKSFEQMLEEIDFEKFIRHDNVCPEKNPEKFRRGQDVNDSFMPHTEYIEEIKKQMKDIIEPNKVYYPSEYPPGVLTKVIEETMLNMYERANDCTDWLNMSVKLAQGSKGYVLRFRDSGKGFNFKEKVKRMKKGKKYSQRKGCGLKILNNGIIESSFEGNGNIVNIMIKKYKSCLGEN